MECKEIFSPGLSIINKDPALILQQQINFDRIFFHKFIRHATSWFNSAFFWQMIIEFIGMAFRIYGLSVIGWLWCIWSRPEQHSAGYEPAPQPLFYSQFSQHVSFKLRLHTYQTFPPPVLHLKQTFILHVCRIFLPNFAGITSNTKSTIEI